MAWFKKHQESLLDILILLIITIPAFVSIINSQYFSMHDDQHIARLFLLNKGIDQGYLYPRWVDWLGFNYGYPLFNFYPPLVYYVAEVFHLLGFSFIWSVKLTFIAGFLVSSVGIFIFVKKLFGRLPGFLSAILYTYFFYHAVNIYVRGALAEFFSMAIIPFIFLTLDNLAHNINLKNSFFFGFCFAVLILCHPLIAFPAVFYIAFFVIFYFFVLIKNRFNFIKYLIIGVFFGLALSSFFWLPSIAERKFTKIDEILTHELANYKLHYIYPNQFLDSLWGYGGSIAGPYDGMTFQLGRVHILLTIFSIFVSLAALCQKKKDAHLKYFYFLTLLVVFSLFMTTAYSSFIWDNIRFLWYLQFPWRFLTFSGFFIAIIASYWVKLISDMSKNDRVKKIGSLILFIFVSCSAIIIYKKYFKPQKLLSLTDNQLTSFHEVAWRVSRTSFEFVPRGVATKKSELNTTILAIDQNQLPTSSYEIIHGKAGVKTVKDKLGEKIYKIDASEDSVFRLNTYYFPGWQAFLDNEPIHISDNNRLKLITVNLPKGKHELKFLFKDTLVRRVGNISSLISFIVLALFFLLKAKDKQLSRYLSWKR